MPNKKNTQNKSQPSQSGLSPAVKGTIAIMLTLLVVIIVVMIFAKTLFIGNDNSQEPKKTGAITSTEYIPPVTTQSTTQQTEDTAESEQTDAEDYDPYTQDSSNADGAGSEITCTGAVYLHPQPSSKSATLATIPQGAKVKFYRNENGWYYVEYNGQKGYAWQTFFTKPPQ